MRSNDDVETDNVSNDAEPRSYRPARQKRSAETERKFLNAAERLFAENGYFGTKVSDIIRVSGCSTGSFYHRFVDKEGVFRVLMENYSRRIDEVILDVDLRRETHGSLENMLCHIIEVTLDTVQGHAGVYRAAEELAQNDGAIWDRLYSLTEKCGAVLVPRMQEEFAGEIEEPVTLRLTHALQLVILITIRKTLGGGPMLPDERRPMIILQRNAALGILKGDMSE